MMCRAMFVLVFRISHRVRDHHPVLFSATGSSKPIHHTGWWFLLQNQFLV